VDLLIYVIATLDKEGCLPSINAYLLSSRRVFPFAFSQLPRLGCCELRSGIERARSLYTTRKILSKGDTILSNGTHEPIYTTGAGGTPARLQGSSPRRGETLQNFYIELALIMILFYKRVVTLSRLVKSSCKTLW